VATHPNVVELIEWGDDPTPWAIVDNEHKTRLSELGGDASTAELCESVFETAEALRNAALYNLTHLDLRPEHVRLSGDNRRRQVDDWGLERSVAESHETEYVTPYTAPEQLDGSLGSQGERTDVYALAGLAYFGLTGVPPKTATAHSVLHEDPVPAADAAEAVPDEVETVLDRGLSKYPAARPDSPFAFATQFLNAAESTQEPHSTRRTAGSAAHTRDDRPGPRDGGTVSTSGSDGVLDSLSPDATSRRRGFLKTAGGGLVLVGIGAAVAQFRSDDQVDPALASVPPAVDFVAHVETEQLLSDDGLRQTVASQVSRQVDSMAATTLEGVLDHSLPGLQLDPREVHEAVAFGSAVDSPSQYAGLILRTEWDSERVASAIRRSDASTNRTGYRERAVYVVDSDRVPWTVLIGFLGDSEFVIGTRPEVQDVIDQSRGETGSLPREVSRAFESASRGAIRLGFDVSEAALRQVDREQISTLAANVESGYGSVGNDPDRPVVLTLRAASPSAAEELEGQLSAAFVLLRSRVNESPDDDGELQTRLQQLIDDTEISRDRTNVSVEFPNGLDLVSVTLFLLL
jgi:Protein kinase domain.